MRGARPLAGLGLFTLTGQAWLDPVAGFVIAAFAVPERREAWKESSSRATTTDLPVLRLGYAGRGAYMITATPTRQVSAPITS